MTCREFGQGSGRGLWLHGWLGTGEEGKELQKNLGESFQLCCPDLPGHGGTLLEGWTMRTALEAIASLAEGCEWASGYSLGGRLLMMAAARYPDAFPKLVIESAFLGYPDAQTRAERKNIDLQRAEKLKSQGLEEFCRDWYRMEMWGGWTDFPERKGDPDELAGALTLFSVSHQPDLRQWIQTTPQRILWMAGQKDPVYAQQAAWVKAHTRHEVVLPETGHNVHLQQPRAWTSSILNFLEKDGRGQDQ